MTLNSYISKWLYDNDGYYSSYKTIGKEGDFYTSVSTSMLFGGTIAKKIIDDIENNKLPKNTTILEIGAHHGYLLADIIQFIYTLKPTLLDTLNFAIVERFEHLRKQQKEYFFSSFSDKITLLQYSDINEVKLDSAYIISNEIFDAFGCEIITTQNGIRKIATINNHQIDFIPCENHFINSICDKYNIKKGEIAIGYEEFIKTINQNINNYIFLTFDYGDKIVRNDISLRVYKDHNVYPFFEENLDLKSLFKNSDITYDVNFSHLIDIFNIYSPNELKYTTQALSLIDFGITDLLEIIKNQCDNDTYLKEANKVKLLLEPTGMGDRFKSLYIFK